MTEPTEPLPCPFCGGINIIHCGHYMYCHACGADGPDADTQYESDARAAWNRRTPQQPVVRDAAPTPAAQQGDADPIRALIARHAEILDQNESAYFELCYHRATGWMAWITDKPLCMPPVVNPDRKVLAQGQGHTPDEACMDAAPAQKDGA
jgi:hypothetical protein